MLIKKKEIAAAALVVLIGCAGYLNWSYQDTMTVRDGESYIETGRKLGEAQLVSTETEVEDKEEISDANPFANTEETASEKNESTEEVKDGSYFENAQYERENARSKSMEILNQTCSNNSFDEETRRKAGDRIILETKNMEAEHEIESIAKSKGYESICAYVHDDGVTVTVKKDGFSQEDALRLSEIAQEQTGIQKNNIKIVNMEQ